MTAVLPSLKSATAVPCVVLLPQLPVPVGEPVCSVPYVVEVPANTVPPLAAEVVEWQLLRFPLNE
jgi:hypothetical protein